MRVDISMSCFKCGEMHSVNVDLAQYGAWLNGELIHRAMPQLSATEMEQLVSRLCPKCQDSIFGSDDEE